jgi:nucleotide-binding universal stress UspA family protein
MADQANIVCAVDDTRRSRRVAVVAERLGRATGLHVVLVHVFDPLVVPVPSLRSLEGTALGSADFVAHERSLAVQHLGELADLIGDVEPTPVLAVGDPHAEILRAIAEHDAQLLVIGSSARKPLERMVQGTFSAELAVTAPCPAVVVTDRASPDGAGPLIAGYDGSEHSLRAARHGAALAAALGRELVLMHVAEEDEPRVEASAELARELHEAAQRCKAGAGRRVDVVIDVQRGDPVEELVRAAREREAALLVVGSRGRNPIKEALLGSVSGGVVRAAEVPVVVAGPRSEAALGGA